MESESSENASSLKKCGGFVEKCGGWDLNPPSAGDVATFAFSPQLLSLFF
jgi:hypothetical protein